MNKEMTAREFFHTLQRMHKARFFDSYTLQIDLDILSDLAYPDPDDIRFDIVEQWAKAHPEEQLEQVGDGICYELSDEQIKPAMRRFDYGDVKPVVRGKWVWKPDKRWWECDQCGEKTTDACMGKPRANYCPWCGADMRKENDTK